MPMKIGDTMPTLEGATEWLNGFQNEAEEYVKGQPTLVHFWATSCGICKEKMPQLKTLKEKYKDKGLRVVAVHLPRYEADTDIEQVKAAVSQYGIDEIVAIDNQHKIKDAFQNEQGWVPVYYLFDAEGKLKSRAAGEFGIGIVTGVLEKMFPTQSASA